MSDEEFFEAFADWKAKVNEIVESEIFIGCDDLEDWGYMEAFEEGISPEEAAEEVLRANIPAYDSF